MTLARVTAGLVVTVRDPRRNQRFLPTRPHSTLAVDLPTARSTSSVGSDTDVKASPFATVDQAQFAAAPSQHLHSAQPQEMSTLRSTTTNSTENEDFLLGASTTAGNPVQELAAASNADLTGTIDAPPTPTQVRYRGIASHGSPLILRCDASIYDAVPRNSRRASM